jgi:hypothetical protein
VCGEGGGGVSALKVAEGCAWCVRGVVEGCVCRRWVRGVCAEGGGGRRGVCAEGDGGGRGECALKVAEGGAGCVRWRW